ncbi:MAG: alkaline phosphatase family protein [Clostridia bacterium]|nr:alkaline phosphatase family protein [Clostridia bacterium]
MEKNKKVSVSALAASALALIFQCVYPTVFIKWIVPLYAVCVLLAAGIAFLLFFALFTAKEAQKPVAKALIGCAVFTAVLMGITPLVNNVIFGAVAPWGSVLTNAVLVLAFWLVMLRLIRKASGAGLKWKPLICLLLVLIGFPVTVLTTAPNVKATGFIVLDTPKNYAARMQTIDIYENTMETAVPQTEVYDRIMDHLKAPLPEGKTEKKVLVLGWDGCRADAMALTQQRRAVDMLLADGGKAYVAYCGGANYPAPITQETATMEGWTTMFTGMWGVDGHGVTGFDKNVRTSKVNGFFTTAIEDGLIDSSAFCFSWSGHLETYKDEIAYDKANNINAAWLFSEGEEGGEGDDGTFEKAMGELQKPDCPDLLFTIFEYCDYYGHTYGFWGETPEYVEAFRRSNETGAQLINAVKARPTYDTEDWLILISSDHGGYVRGHGGDTLMERMMFIVTNK